MKLSFAAIAAGMLLSVAPISSPAYAQVSTSGTWSNMVIPNANGSVFWDNPSLDGGGRCNVGYFLLYSAGSGYGPCVNQNPTDPFVQANAGRLGLSGNTPNGSFLSNDAFSFAAGQYQVEFLANIAGYDPRSGQQSFGFTSSGAFQQFYPVGSYPNGLTTTFNFTVADSWWIGARDSNGPNPFLYSNTASPNWALFSERSASDNPGQSNTTWYAGLGDAAGDGDYQDVVLRITAVPEPATFVTLGLGLGMVGFFHRRRRQA